MVKRYYELKKETIPKLKCGNGMIQLVNILSVDEMENQGRLFAVTVIPPKCSIGLHSHKGDFETYYILSGKAEVNTGGKVYELGPGDVTICEDGSSHSIKNIGEGDLEYIALILYSSPND